MAHKPLIVASTSAFVPSGLRLEGSSARVLRSCVSVAAPPGRADRQLIQRTAGHRSRAGGPSSSAEGPQAQGSRPRLRRRDRLVMAAIARVLPRARWTSFLVSPQTLLRWHRELVRRKWTFGRRSTGGRPPITGEVAEEAVRKALRSFAP